MSNETENENHRRIERRVNQLENRQETSEKIQEANMEILRAEHRTSHEELLRRIAEYGKDTSRTIMFAAFSVIGVTITTIGVATVILGFWLQPVGGG